MKIDKSWYIKPKDKNFPSALSCGGAVIRKDRNKFKIALIRDKKFNDFMLPKGGMEKDEGKVVTARREIAEETGLEDLEYLGKLGFKERLTFEKNEWRRTYYFLFATNQIKGIQKLEEGEEDYIVEWYDKD